MAIDDTENAENTRAESGLAEQYVEARGEELRAEADDTDTTFAEDKAEEIQSAIDKGETSREDVEANWDKEAEAQDNRIEDLSREWEIDEGLIERFDAILDDPDASPERAADAADLKADAEARIEDYKAELDKIAADRQSVSLTREALGWADETPQADDTDDDGDWIPEPEDDAGTESATETSGTEVATAPGDGVETPQNERTYDNGDTHTEETEPAAEPERQEHADDSGVKRTDAHLFQQYIQRQYGR